MSFLKKIYIFFFNFKFIVYFKRYKLDLFIGKGYLINKLKYITLGKNIRIGRFSRISFYKTFSNRRYQPKLYIGDNAYIGDFFTVLCTDNIIIEENVLIASYVTITSENHGISLVSELPYSKQPLESKPIKIGKGCWIGEKVTILPGVSIGEKSIIGTGSVVTKSIDNYSIAVGNPAKVIKKYNFQKMEWEKINNKITKEDLNKY